MKWIIFSLQVLPYVLDAVKAAEAAITGAGKGSAKLDLVLGAMEAVYSVLGAEVKDLPREGVTKLVIGLVDRAVSIFNAIGVFRTSPAA